MKKLIYAIMAVMPLASMAQPTIKKAMDYTAGTSVKMVNCDHVSPGTSGANQTWDLSALVSNDTTTFDYVAVPTGTTFTGATIMEKSSDTSYQYISKTSGGMYIVGLADSSVNGGGTVINYDNTMLMIKNQLTYGLTASDTFSSNMSFGGFSVIGKGTIDMKVDGYGTLKVPGKTYTNVLRVRVERNEVDTIPPPINMTFDIKMVSYMWFDTANVFPLCRVDSNEYDGTSELSAGYMVPKQGGTAINDIKSYKADFTATFSNNNLVINNNFNKTKEYEVMLFNTRGQKLIAQTFTPSGNTKTLDINTEILPGIYMIYLQEAGNPQTASVIKLAKR